MGLVVMAAEVAYLHAPVDGVCPICQVSECEPLRSAQRILDAAVRYVVQPALDELHHTD